MNILFFRKFSYSKRLDLLGSTAKLLAGQVIARRMSRPSCPCLFFRNSENPKTTTAPIFFQGQCLDFSFKGQRSCKIFFSYCDGRPAGGAEPELFFQRHGRGEYLHHHRHTAPTTQRSASHAALLAGRAVSQKKIFSNDR